VGGTPSPSAAYRVSCRVRAGSTPYRGGMASRIHPRKRGSPASSPSSGATSTPWSPATWTRRRRRPTPPLRRRGARICRNP